MNEAQKFTVKTLKDRINFLERVRLEKPWPIKDLKDFEQRIVFYRETLQKYVNLYSRE